MSSQLPSHSKQHPMALSTLQVAPLFALELGSTLGCLVLLTSSLSTQGSRDRSVPAFLCSLSRCLWGPCIDERGFPGSATIINLPVNAGDQGLLSRSGRSPGVGNGNPLQYSCWRVHGHRSLMDYSPWGHKSQT